ncbi:hypothetical protein ACFVU2_21280 [Leifsonia sp. NPDC058194]|uniref:hypothetical protein n=1 Tax=Leifsonia sp. NPDC058194 TaxID=3346374 RepID=UPI0036DC35F7
MVGQKIAATIRDNHYDKSVVAKAADMTVTALDERLEGGASFSFEQLIAVGGFLALSVPDLFEEVVTT